MNTPKKPIPPRKNQDQQSGSGSSKHQGLSIEPNKALPEEPTNDDSLFGGEIPIGMPITPDEFRKLKRRAEKMNDIESATTENDSLSAVQQDQESEEHKHDQEDDSLRPDE